MLKIGLLINPLAGVGGRLALKGSDDRALHAGARAAGATGRGAARVQRMLATLGDARFHLEWVTWPGAMGADALAASGCVAHVAQAAGAPRADLTDTTAADTQTAVRAMLAEGIDLLVFAGGDGTARDLLSVLGDRVPVLGVPAGVKMHSGVFAITPESAAAVLASLVSGGLVRATSADVRDLDEAALREGVVQPRYYGELKVPEQGGFLQHTKESGRENEALALAEIVAETVERIRAQPGLYLLGPGSSVAAVKSALGIEPTLIGVDVLDNGTCVAADATAAWLERYLADRPDALPTLVLSFTRQQGFLLGRGNLQLSPPVLRAVGRSRIWILATRSKLLSLDGRPLLIDTDDPALDQALCGLYEIIAGYDDRLWYQVATGS